MASASGFDLLQLLFPGRLLRWRWGRLLWQCVLLSLALLVIYDGLSGPQLAPLNLATVLVWIHYRGGVLLLLILAGNLFCLGCPFALLRTIAPRLAVRGRRWPRRWRNKWGGIALFLSLLWLYEWLDLWASPRLTAWLVVGFFVVASALELLFRESPFCKYLCPLGLFNTFYALLAPLQVGSVTLQVCGDCQNHECVNGGGGVAGCGTELYVPRIRNNLDCVLCLDCVRACPHENVALYARWPGQRVGVTSWKERWDLALLPLLLAFAGLSNAFGMVPPMYALQMTLSRWLGVESEALLLMLIQGVASVLLPAGLGVLATLPGRGSIKASLVRYGPVLLPLGFAIWGGHYLFHFATGALTVLPVLTAFAADHGISVLGGEPNWALGALVPSSWLLPLQIAVLLAGLVGSLRLLGSVQAVGVDGSSGRSSWPWFILLLLLALAAVVLFTLPMEMRGTTAFGH